MRTISFATLALFIAPLASAGAYEDFFQAAALDDVGAIRSLLKRGLDPNIVEPERGDTALMIAVRENAMKVFAALLDANNIDIEQKSRNGDNALMIAAYKGNKAAVQALLAKGAQVNRAGWTPLHYAAASGSDDIVRLLLEKAATVDAASPNSTTPIMMAARGGHIMTVKILLDAGADASLKNELGMNAIDFANRNNHTDIADGLTRRLKKAGKL